MATVAFDVIGTLFSVEPVYTEIRRLGATEDDADLWLAEGLRDHFGLSLAGAYQPVARTLEGTLPRALARRGVEIDEEAAGMIMAALGRMPAAAGAEVAVRRLSEAGWSLYCVTNGAEDTTRQLLDDAGFHEAFAGVLSCDEVAVSKPHPRVYETLRERAGDDTWLVAAHGWDIDGAKRAGLRTAWIADDEFPHFPPFYEKPDVIGTDLADVAEELLAR